jgi:hypothetical protein
MDLSKYPIWLESHLHLWKRKEFKDFDYIENELTKGQSIALLIIILIMDIVASIFFIGNDIDNNILYNDDSYASSSVIYIRDKRNSIWDMCHIVIDSFVLLFGFIYFWLTLQLVRFGDSISQYDDYMRITK